MFPREAAYGAYRDEHGHDDHTVPPVVEELKVLARERGLWNLFLPSESGLTQLEYATLAELSGWSNELAPEALNCQAPDTGNMELLHLFGTDEQKQQWLEPLLAGRDPVRLRDDRAGGGVLGRDQHRELDRAGRRRVRPQRPQVVHQRCLRPAHPGADLHGQDRPRAAERHRQQSMVIVPIDTPGVTVGRSVTVFGQQHQPGHAVTTFEDVRVPVGNLLGEEGGGFAMAQARLGPGRIHHVMRALGAGERALAMMVARVQERVAFGKPLAEQGARSASGSRSRGSSSTRPAALCHRAAYVIDTQGNKAARNLVAEAKVAVPRIVTGVIDRAIQVHGGLGVTNDIPLADMWGWHRAMRIFDGPDEVHLTSIARAELGRAPRFRL